MYVITLDHGQPAARAVSPMYKNNPFVAPLQSMSYLKIGLLCRLLRSINTATRECPLSPIYAIDHCYTPADRHPWSDTFEGGIIKQASLWVCGGVRPSSPLVSVLHGIWIQRASVYPLSTMITKPMCTWYLYKWSNSTAMSVSHRSFTHNKSYSVDLFLPSVSF